MLQQSLKDIILERAKESGLMSSWVLLLLTG